MGYGILTGNEIRSEVERGIISIDPYDASKVNEASYDLSLGGEISEYGVKDIDTLGVAETRYKLSYGDSFVISPGFSYLMHTAERICTEHYVGVLNGKSSIGRLFVMVHCTAGYIDPGFDGQYTLEVSCAFHTNLVIGMRIAQVHFHTLAGLPVSYKNKGHYVGERARGAVSSVLKGYWL
jgi:dCTP deaminase